MQAAFKTPEGGMPVSIGGIGGSGTRLIASLLRAMGVHMGDDLNEAYDALGFTLVFKRPEILHCADFEFDFLTSALTSALRQGQPFDECAQERVHALARENRPHHSAAWLKMRAHSLIASAARPAENIRWGWKEPNTHIVVDRLLDRLPSLRYIHVVRHGLDMAYSSNQNQLQLWGLHVLGNDEPVTPRRSLAYWCKVHQRIQQLKASHPSRIYWLDYDALCRDPMKELDGLWRFLGYAATTAEHSLCAHIQRQPSRHDRRPVDVFNPGDVDYVRSLGYRVGSP